MGDGTKTVRVEIDGQDLEKLKLDGFSLCLAKHVNGAYDVVWLSLDGEELLANNTYSWTPDYELFVCDYFESGGRITSMTQMIKTPIGQKATFDSRGALKGPNSAASSTGLTLENDYKSIHPAVSQRLGDIWRPIYVAQRAVPCGSTTLTPVDKVLLWFDRELETGRMFDPAQVSGFEVDLTGDNSVTVSYEGGKWTRA